MAFLNKIQAVVLFLGIVLLVLIQSSSSLDPVLMPRYTYFSILILIVVLFSFSKKGRKEWSVGLSFLKSFTGISLLLFLFTGLLSLLWNGVNGDSSFYWLKDVLLAVYTLVLISFVPFKSKTFLTLLKAIVFSTLVILFLGFYQLIPMVLEGNFSAKTVYQITSNMAHKNLLASVLAISLPFTIYSYYIHKNAWKWLAGISILGSLVLIGLLQTRSVWIAVAVFFAMFFFLKLFENRKWNLPKWISKKSVLAFSAIILIAFSIRYFQPTAELKGQSLEFNIDGTSDKTFTIQERILLWKGSLNMVWDNSFVGVGPGNWRIQFPKYGSDIWRARQGLVQFQRPHNDYIWILTEQGIIGLLSYLLLFGGVLFYGFKLLSNKEIGAHQKLFVKLLISGILAYMVVAFFSFPKERIVHQVLLFTAFGLLIGQYVRVKKQKEDTGKKTQLIVPLLALIISGLSVYVGLQRWRGEVLTQRILSARVQQNWLNMQKLSQQASNLAFYTTDPTSVPIAFYEGLAQFNQGNNTLALDCFTQAYQVHPNNIHVINNLASLNQLLNQNVETVKYYKQALAIAPKYLDGALNLASIYFNTNHVNQSYTVLSRYRNSFPANHEAYQQYLLTIMKTVRSNTAESIKDSLLSETISTIDEKWLLSIHESTFQDTSALFHHLLENAIYGLEKISYKISAAQAEEYRNLYLNK